VGPFPCFRIHGGRADPRSPWISDELAATVLGWNTTQFFFLAELHELHNASFAIADRRGVPTLIRADQPLDRVTLYLAIVMLPRKHTPWHASNHDSFIPELPLM